MPSDNFKPSSETVDTAGRSPWTHRYIIPEVQCAACCNSIRNALNELLSDAEYKLSHQLSSKQCSLNTQAALSDENIGLLFSRTGHRIQAGSTPLQSSQDPNSLTKAAIALSLGVPVTIVTALGLCIPWLWLTVVIQGLMLIALYYTGYDMLSDGLKQLSQCQLKNMHVPVTITVIISAIALFIPGAHAMLEMGLIVLAAQHIAADLRRRMYVQRNKILCLNLGLPKEVQCGKKQKSVTDLEVGDIVTIAVGDIVPCDAELLDESGLIIDESGNGRHDPKLIQKGTKLLSGTYARSKLTLKILAKAEDSQLQQIATAINIGSTHDERLTPMEHWIAQFNRYFFPTVMVLAVVIAATFIPLLGWSLAINTILGLLVSACPCSLALIEPWLQDKIGIEKLKAQNLTVKKPATIGLARQIKSIFIDFNGTITTGNSTVSQQDITDNSIDKKTLSRLLYLLEGDSNHRVAQALLSSIDKNNFDEAIPEATTPIAHNGISKLIDGKTYHIGNAAYLEQQNIKMPQSGPGKIYLYQDNTRLAEFTLTDQLKADAINTINTLKAQGYGVIICSGDEEDRIRAILDSKIPVIANCKNGQEKIERIKQYLQEHEQTDQQAMMVGDGTNDALALLKFLGIYVPRQNSAKDLCHPHSKESAEVVCESEQLQAIFHFLQIAHQIHNATRFCLIAILSVDFSWIALSIGMAILMGSMAPCIMAFSMVGMALLILSVGLYLRYQPLTTIKKDSVTDAKIEENSDRNTPISDAWGKFAVLRSVGNQCYQQASRLLSTYCCL